MDGWPFLVARGRRRGYSTLLVPGYLLDEGRYGFLEETAAPTGSAPFRVAAVAGSAHLVWAEHAVTRDDAGGDPHDEYGRPLRLTYGFLCPRGRPRPAPAELRHALDTAQAVYRRFLAGEDRFAAEPSGPFALAEVTVPALVVGPPPVPPRIPRYLWAGAALVAAVAAVVWWLVPGSSPTPDPPCPSPTVTPLPATTFACLTPAGGQATYDPQNWPAKPASAK